MRNADLDDLKDQNYKEAVAAEWRGIRAMDEKKTQTTYPPVLDACCGGRMFWFDKKDQRALYMDTRKMTRVIDLGTAGTRGRKPRSINPDKLADFREMPYPDNSFFHVVFDPPHFYKGAGASGVIAFDYGLLTENWREDLAKGFSECFRVLKPLGTLIFKWCETEIPLKDVLRLTSNKPLYGHRSGKKAKTHWVAFIKETA